MKSFCAVFLCYKIIKGDIDNSGYDQTLQEMFLLREENVYIEFVLLQRMTYHYFTRYLGDMLLKYQIRNKLY